MALAATKEHLLQDPWFALWLVLATLAFALLRTHLTSRSPPLPPGPMPLPIIGNMLMMDQLTHRGLAALAGKYGGLLHLRLGRVHTVVVSTPEYAREVLQVQDIAFSNRPASTAIAYLTYDRADMAFAHYGHFWRQVRKLSAVKLFSRRRTESWLAVREGSAELVRTVAESAGQSINVGELIFALTNNVVLRAAFGTRDGGRQDEFIALMQEFSGLFGAFNVGDFIPWLGWVDARGINKRLRAARAFLDELIDKIIDEHVKSGKSTDDADADMVDDMLAFLDEATDGDTTGDGDELHNGFRLTRNNIKAIIMDFMFGGTETVASTVEWALAELLRSRGNLRRLQRELADVVGLDRNVDEGDVEKLPFFRSVVKEILRLHPPVPFLLHETAVDCVVGGRYTVPVGSRVIVNVWAINRDGEAWGKDANAFRPARFMPGEGEAAAADFKGGCFQFIPFGSGRRACPAIVFGLYELELMLARLVHAFEWALPGGMKPEELDMADVFGLTAPRAVRLHAVPTPRLTCPH
uniref:Uncharacterized protein n=1 Tax=Avena sativa TaxID=4498 RepID=A0ACD5WJV0_AVESA